DAASQTVLSKINHFKSIPGGSCGSSCVLFVTKPVRYREPAFLYEGDFQGGLMRMPGQAIPKLPSVLVASNHFHIYGVDPDIGPSYNFGKQVYYNTLQRYGSGSDKVLSLSRTAHGQGDEKRIIELLRTAAHGTTEHSVLYHPRNGKVVFSVSNADMKLLAWDAPYLDFIEYEFEELFQ